MFSFKKNKLKNVDTETINELDLTTPEEKHLSKILNIVLIIVVILSVMISIDVVCVNKYQKGPFFALRLSTYQDGGTKVYYGFGYKVIKYHQKMGRRDMVIGLWTMPYNTKPTTISTLDLAIELRNNPEKAYKKYAKQFLKVEGEVYKVDKANKELTLRYKDQDQKYSLDIICHMEKNNGNLSKGDSVEVIGTVGSYILRDSKERNSVNTLKMKYCFAK